MKVSMRLPDRDTPLSTGEVLLPNALSSPWVIIRYSKAGSLLDVSENSVKLLNTTFLKNVTQVQILHVIELVFLKGTQIAIPNVHFSEIGHNILIEDRYRRAFYIECSCEIVPGELFQVHVVSDGDGEVGQGIIHDRLHARVYWVIWKSY